MITFCFYHRFNPFSDDLNIASDFFEYFEGLYQVLKSDESLYCVSAWNDNGKAKHIEDKPGLCNGSSCLIQQGRYLLIILDPVQHDSSSE